MDISRAEGIADIYKTTRQLGKDIKKPSLKMKTPAILGATLPPEAEGSGVFKIIMYIVAGLLLIGLILLGVDQWITPIFIRKPGGQGYISIPGTDSSDHTWVALKDAGKNIVIGIPTAAQLLADPTTLSTSVISGQSNFSITMDIFINSSYTINSSFTAYNSANSGTLQKRTLFWLGTTTTTGTTSGTAAGSLAAATSDTASRQKLTVTMDSFSNTLYVTGYKSNGLLPQTATIENIPMNTPFRLGIVVSPYTLEAYLNGLLVMTKQLQGTNIQPLASDLIFATSNMLYTPASGGTNTFSLSDGITVMNLRTFGYAVTPAEMIARMNDLTPKSTIFPPPK